MAALETLPNIGKVLAGRLQAAGIETDAQLLKLGDAAAFRRICNELPDDACTHTRLALAGAARGVRWHDLDAELKKQLAEEAHSWLPAGATKDKRLDLAHGRRSSYLHLGR